MDSTVFMVQGGVGERQFGAMQGPGTTATRRRDVPKAMARAFEFGSGRSGTAGAQKSSRGDQLLRAKSDAATVAHFSSSERDTRSINPRLEGDRPEEMRSARM